MLHDADFWRSGRVVWRIEHVRAPGLYKKWGERGRLHETKTEPKYSNSIYILHEMLKCKYQSISFRWWMFFDLIFDKTTRVCDRQERENQGREVEGKVRKGEREGSGVKIGVLSPALN